VSRDAFDDDAADPEMRAQHTSQQEQRAAIFF
jgi:hypothetical protein